MLVKDKIKKIRELRKLPDNKFINGEIEKLKEYDQDKMKEENPKLSDLELLRFV
jgi:hypothetical protein